MYVEVSGGRLKPAAGTHITPSPLRARHLCVTPCASRAAPPHPAAPAQALEGGWGGASRAGKQLACVAAQRVPNAGDLAPVVICAAGCALRRVASVQH